MSRSGGAENRDGGEPGAGWERVRPTASSPRPCTSREEELDRSLRPQSLADFVGQERVKEQLAVALDAAKARGEALDHVLLAGPPGLGKTSLAQIVRRELGVGIRQIAGPALERKGDIAAILTALEPRDVLFVDEIHRLNRAVEEILYPALEDFRLDIVVGQGPGRAHAHARPAAVHARRRDDAHRPADDAAARPLRPHVPARPLHARRARRDRPPQRADPRRRDRRRRRRRDRPPRARHAADREPDPPPRPRRRRGPARGRDHDRRSPTRRSSCSRSTRRGSSGSTASSCAPSSRSSAAGRSGLSTLAVALGEEAETIEDVYEPYLLQLGFLQRTPRGQDRHRARPRRTSAPTPRGFDALLTSAPGARRSRQRCLRRVPVRRLNPSTLPICSCSAGSRRASSCISAEAGAAKAGRASSRSRSTTRRRSRTRSGPSGRSASTTTTAASSSGPYYAHGAVIVPVVPDMVVVFGAVDGRARRRRRHARGGGAGGRRCRRAAGPPARSSSDELELLEAVRTAATRPAAGAGRPGDGASSPRSRPRRSRASSAPSTWPTASGSPSSTAAGRSPAPHDALADSCSPRCSSAAEFPFCVQDAKSRPLPGRSRASPGSARTTCSS